MMNIGSRCGGAKHAVLAQRRVLTMVGAAVCIALYGAAHPVRADDAAQATVDASLPTLQEITVTASRRTQTAESTPYSLTVITPQQLANANVTDISSLTTQVPGLSMYDFGARVAGATVPILRGINATGEPRGFRSFEQSPVGVYV
ncbi:MAG: TonB-dependent receptor plug domain-containing protein, partial [Steroidobacteraceae bacterium]